MVKTLLLVVAVTDRAVWWKAKRRDQPQALAPRRGLPPCGRGIVHRSPQQCRHLERRQPCDGIIAPVVDAPMILRPVFLAHFLHAQNPPRIPLLRELVVYLHPADNSPRLTHRLSKDLKGLYEWALLAFQ